MKNIIHLLINKRSISYILGTILMTPGITFGSEIYLGLFAPYKDYCALEIYLQPSSNYLYIRGAYNPRISGKCEDTRWYSYEPDADFPRKFWYKKDSKKACNLVRKSNDWFAQYCFDIHTDQKISEVHYYLFDRN